MRTVVIFDNFGPYHLARLVAAASVTKLMAVEVAPGSSEYAWKRFGENTETLKPETLKSEGNVSKSPGQQVGVSSFKSVTLLESGSSRDTSAYELTSRLNGVLDDFRSGVVFVPGWSSKAALIALAWCLQHSVPAVVMSESTERDEPRVNWKEWVKRRIVGLSSAALVGGMPHKDYLVRLGMPADRVFLGYDVVDNRYFEDKAAEVRSQKSEVRTWESTSPRPSPQSGEGGLPDRYFLASARFIEKKNLPRLIEAYSRYRELASKSEIKNKKSEIWNLVLLGDGGLRSSLESQVSSLQLHAHVQMPGFKQYPELPAYYGLANAFIHASTTEQWGLVVNEAMASSLPVLVSNRCGCAADLVREGVNGFTFDPYNVEELAGLMLRISDFRFPISDFGKASQRIITDWGPARFAQGFKAAVEKAVAVGAKSATWFDRRLLEVLLRQ